MENEFHLFGAQHVATLGSIAGFGTLALLFSRRGGETGKRNLRWIMAGLLLSTHIMESAVALWRGWYEIQMLPLEMCDLAALFGAYGLLTLDRRAIGPAYFFAMSGTLPALITPELDVGFPHFRFVAYFVEHGLTVLTPLVPVFGLGLVPRRGAWLRAFWVINGFAVVDGALNIILGTNFMYLSHKPHGPTPFDWFGPWPGYLLVLESLVLLLFRLLEIPLGTLRREGDAPDSSSPARTGSIDGTGAKVHSLRWPTREN